MSKIVVALLVAFVACTLSQKTLTGAELLNLGMDFRQGGLVPAEERAKSQIFTYSYANPPRVWSPPGRADLKFKIPQECTFIPTGGTYEKSSSEIYKSYSQVVKVDIKGFNIGISIDTGKFGVGANYGAEFGKIQQRIKEEFKSITRGEYRSSVYKVVGKPHFLRKYHSDFEGTVEYIPSTPRTPDDFQRYEEALSYFGGFFQTSSVFGGRVKSFNFLNTKLTSNRDEKWVRHQVSLSFRYKFFELNAGGFRNRSEIKIDDFFSQNMKGDLAYHGGFRNLQNDKNVTKKWKHSIDDQAGLLDSDLRPISDLVKDPVKKASFRKIIETYSLTGKVKSLTKDSKLRIPGYNVLGYGYDPVDMSIKSPIFEHDAAFDKVSTFDKYAVPSSMKAFKTPEAEKKTLSLFTDAKEFTNAFVTKNIKKVSLAAGKRSRDVYAFLQRAAKGQSQVEVDQEVSLYDLKLNPMYYIDEKLASKHMNKYFRKYIKQLGTNYEDKNVREQYMRIIREFGTDFTVAAKIGGSFKTNYFFKNSLLKKHSVEEIEKQAEDSFDGKVVKSTLFTDVQSSVTGGKPENVVGPLSKTPMEQFRDSVSSDPEAISFEILPISVLIKDSKKAKLMERAILEHRQQLAETDPMDENKLLTRDEQERFKNLE